MSILLIPEGDAYAYEAVDLTDDAAHGITATNLYDSNDRPCKFAIITIADNTINFRNDGTAPLTTTGHIFAATTTPFLIVGFNNVKNMSFINAVGASDGVPRVSFYS